MNKSVYSIVLSDDVVAQVDRLAYKAGTSRSAMINRILADYVSYVTPEQRLRDILDLIISSTEEDASILLSIVYRVEVSRDSITIWTILDADPNGTIDKHTEGVTITDGVPSGVPMVFVTSEFLRIAVAR